MSASKASIAGASHATSRKDGYDSRSSHIVQFYREDRALISTLANYFGAALSNGDAAIVVATYEHHAALKAELKSMGHDVNSLIREGRYLVFEAPHLLAQFMVDGMPDASQFFALMNRVMGQAKSSAKGEPPCIVIFGEMVAILWAEGKHEAAIKLEGLWNDLAAKHSFTLRCAYPMTGFSDHAHAEPFMRICCAPFHRDSRRDIRGAGQPGQCRRPLAPRRGIAAKARDSRKAEGPAPDRSAIAAVGGSGPRLRHLHARS